MPTTQFTRNFRREHLHRVYFNYLVHLPWFFFPVSAFYKNVFNSASCLAGQTPRLWFLFQNERVSKPCMTNSQSGYNNLFSSWFSRWQEYWEEYWRYEKTRRRSNSWEKASADAGVKNSQTSKKWNGNIGCRHHQRNGDERKIKKEYLTRVRKLLEKKKSSAVGISSKGINTYAVSLLRDSGLSIKWSME